MKLRPAVRAAVLATLAAALGQPSAAQSESGEFARPKYSLLRQNEDWSDLAGRDTSQTGDWLDAIKYLPIGEDGPAWVSFGGHVRTRFERWNNFNFGRPPGVNHDDTFNISRLLLHADVHVDDRLRVYTEVKSATSTDRNLPGGERTMDVDTNELQQLFVDYETPVGDGDLTIRPGRQMLLLGKQRLVSPLAWSNALRHWDGISTIYCTDDWTVTGFWTQFAPVQKTHFNEPTHNSEIWGLYGARQADGNRPAIDAYLLGIDRNGVAFNGTAGNEERYTLGVRLDGVVGGKNWDYEVETAYQFGDIGPGDISATMFTSNLGYTFAECESRPRVFVGFDYASGDDAAGGDVETFNHLFPLGHAYLGYIDAIGRQNILDASVGVSARMSEKCTLAATLHNFWLDDKDDALYTAGGGVSIAGGTSTDSRVGSEIDFTARRKISRHVSALFGYSHFFKGSVVDDSGAPDDIDFVYLSFQFTF